MMPFAAGPAPGGVAPRARTPRVEPGAPIRFAPFTASLFREELFERVGLLEEVFESYLEDVDFGIRCATNGYSGIYVPDAVARTRAARRWGGGIGTR